MNFRNFFSHKYQMGAVTLFTVLTILSFFGDWFGYDTRLPEPNTIESAHFNLSSFTDSASDLSLSESGVLVDNLDVLFGTYMNYKDTQRIYDLLFSIIPKQDSEYSSDYTWLQVKVTLKNGSHFYREYKVAIDDAALLKPIVESPEYKQSLYPMYTGALGLPSRIEIKSVDYKTTYNLNKPDEISDFMNAYYSDFNRSYCLENLAHGFLMAHVNISYYFEKNGRSRMYSLPIKDNYTETLAALRSISSDTLLEEDQLAIASLTISPDIDPNLSDLEANLRNYFGYESQTSLTEESLHTNPAATMEQQQYAIAHTYTIQDKEEIAQLMQELRVGIDYNHTFFRLEFIRIGYLTTTDGLNYSIYAKPGTFPAKYIDDLIEMYQSQSNTSQE